MGIFEGLVDRGLSFRESLPAFHDFLAKKPEELGRALGIIGVAVNAGIPMDRALELVLYIYEHAAIEGYAFMALYDELDSLRANEVDGETLFRALMNVSGKDPYHSQGNYSVFTQLLYVAATQTQYSQQEILEKLNEAAAMQRVVAGKRSLALKAHDEQATDPLLQVSRELDSHSDSASGAVAQKEPERYFPELALNKLVHGILPYRLQKGYGAGLMDLKRLVENGFSEGAWMWDQGKQMWYSLGGKTSLNTGKVRHEFFPYDVSKLSKTPVFIHIHPEKCETFLVPNVDALAVPQFQKKLTKFFASMPSAADFELFASLLESASAEVPLKAVIVTSLGITEVVFPNDVEQIRKLAATFRDLKDNTLLWFDAVGYYQSYGIEEEDITFVRRLAHLLNEQLPEGFQIIVRDFDEYVANHP